MKTHFNLLRVEDLTFGYHSGAPVLHEVNLDVNEHEIVTVLGSNGAGKSTLLKSIAGLLAPWHGRVTFQGEDITSIPAHQLVSRGLALCPTGRMVFPDQTVEENLLIGAHSFRKDRRRVSRMLDHFFDRFEILGTKRRANAGTLSAGEQQILSIARSLMTRPRLILLDEPTLGLSPASIKSVVDLIVSVRDEGSTILMVEKLAHLASRLSDRICVLELGRVLISGPADEVSGDPRVEEAYLGRSRGSGSSG